MFAYSSPTTFRAWDDASNLLLGEVFFDHAPTEAQLSEAFPNYVAPPSPTPALNFLQFLALFTTAEQAAIMTARRTDVQVDLFVTMAAGANGIQLDDPRVVQGVDYLVAQNIITQAEGARVLSGQPPS